MYEYFPWTTHCIVGWMMMFWLVLFLESPWRFQRSSLPKSCSQLYILLTLFYRSTIKGITFERKRFRSFLSESISIECVWVWF